MNRKDIEKVVNLIIDEEFDKANTLIGKIMSEETKSIYKRRLIEDGDLKCPDKDSEIEEDLEDLDDNALANDEMQGTEDVDSDEDSASTAEENPESSPSEINYQFTDIQKDIERLKREFQKSMNLDQDEVTGDESVETTDDGDLEVDEDVYDSDPAGIENEASPLTFANEDEENLESDDNIFNESDLDDIAEALELSTVNVDMKSNKEAGNGKSIKVDDKSFVDTHEGEKGSPIEIKSSGEPKGTGREPSPKVADSKIKSTNTMDLKTVSKEGDKSAKINSKDGFGKDEDDSPLSKIKR